MTARKVYLEHSCKPRLSTLAAAAVLAGGWGAASASNAFAADNEISSSINITEGDPNVPPPDTGVGHSNADQDVIELKQNTSPDGRYAVKKLPADRDLVRSR